MVNDRNIESLSVASNVVIDVQTSKKRGEKNEKEIKFSKFNVNNC